MFSLVSGTYRQAKRFGGQGSSASVADSGNPSAVVLRNQENMLAALSDSAASEYFFQKKKRLTLVGRL